MTKLPAVVVNLAWKTAGARKWREAGFSSDGRGAGGAGWGVPAALGCEAGAWAFTSKAPERARAARIVFMETDYKKSFGFGENGAARSSAADGRKMHQKQ